MRTREREDTSVWWRSRVNHSAAIIPSPVAWILGKKARQARRIAAAKTVARVSVALGMLALLMVHATPAMSLQPPSVPADEQICGSSILNGPSSAPGGATTVPAGDNSAFSFSASTTYWFAAGTHTIGNSVFSQIQPAAGSVFTGAPGAILSGQGINHFAFTGTQGNVTIEYLTIEDFAPPGGQGAVNINGNPDWTVEYDTIQDNVPGAAMMLGSNSVTEYNCLTENGEYGFNGYSVNDTSPVTGGIFNVTLTGNEISYNDTCNWEVDASFPITPPAGCTGAGQFAGCGCSGGGKFWETDGATVSDNYVHDNYAVGMWADTNNAGFGFTGNYVSGNYATGIEYEISYNALIQDNIFVRNAIGVGPNNPDFPSSAVYLSESGSDPRVGTAYNSTYQITGNQFYDNWGGVVLWENSNRFCTSPANTSTGTCTLVNPQANLSTCSYNQPSPIPPSRPVSGSAPPSSRRGHTRGGTTQGQNFSLLIGTNPYINDCRWKTQNVQVTGNLFDFTPGNIGATCTTGNYCGFNGIFSQFGSIYPYQGTTVENSITFSQGDLFTGNTYCGPWQFDILAQGNVGTWATWQGSPYSQDAGSTLNGNACNPLPVPPPNVVNRTITIPIKIGGGSR